MIVCPNGLNKTKIVSFPRSGQHLLVRGLQWILQGKLIYSNFYESAHNFENNEFVNCQKSHDFDLQEPYQEDLNYIILIRAFEPAVESWWEAEGHQLGNQTVTLKDFRHAKMDYFDKFNEKWVLNPKENQLVIPYHELINNKPKWLMNCYKTMTDKPMHDEKYQWLLKWELAESVKTVKKKK